VVATVKLAPTAHRLLDVGGGHGLYSIAFCRRHAQLTATIFDLAPALAVAHASVAGSDVEGRVTVQEGDFCTDELGAGYDVALVFNIVHSHQPEQNVELLRKAARALIPGGLIVILDQFADAQLRSPTARAVARLNGLNLFNASGGQCYSAAEISAWLEQAGFGPPRRIDLLTSPGNGLLLANTARRPAA
jgi:SAM-dependent methyltransferase